MSDNSKLLIGSLGIILLVGLALGLIYVQRTQDLQSRATGSVGSWDVKDSPDSCSGSWYFDTSYTKQNIDLKENYSITLEDGVTAILFDYDNDPKCKEDGGDGNGSWPNCNIEVGHIFIIDGKEVKVPMQNPNNDDRWSMLPISGVRHIAFSRNEDSGGSNICIVTKVTPTLTPKASPTPTPTGQVCQSPNYCTDDDDCDDKGGKEVAGRCSGNDEVCCMPRATPTPTATRTPTPTVTATPVPSNQPTPTPTATPIVSNTPTPTSEPTPTMCPLPQALNVRIICESCTQF